MSILSITVYYCSEYEHWKPCNAMFWLFHVHIHRYPWRPNFCTVLRAVPHEFIGIIIPVDKNPPWDFCLYTERIVTYRWWSMQQHAFFLRPSCRWIWNTKIPRFYGPLGILTSRAIRRFGENVHISALNRPASIIYIYQFYIITQSVIILRASCGAVYMYCNGPFVCGSVTTITRNGVHRSSPNWVCR